MNITELKAKLIVKIKRIEDVQLLRTLYSILNYTSFKSPLELECRANEVLAPSGAKRGSGAALALLQVSNLEHKLYL